MITIRNQSGLSSAMIPFLREFEACCRDDRLDVLIHCTDRTLEEQAILFRSGRSLSEIEHRAGELRDLWGRPDLADILMGVGPQKGSVKRTNAAPGQSAHNYGLAWDGGPIWHGKIIYDGPENWVPDDIEAELWSRYTACARKAGLVTLSFERPHCQHPDFNWRERIRTEVFRA